MAERKNIAAGFNKSAKKVQANTKVRKPTFLGQIFGMMFFGPDAGKEY